MDNETAVFFILGRMEITAVLYFLRNGVKLHFYSLGTIFEENMRGIQRGEIPWLWVSNRGEKHPCWHTILLAKYTRDLLYRGMGGTTGRNG